MRDWLLDSVSLQPLIKKKCSQIYLVFVLVGLFVCLSARPSDNLKNNERIRMKRLPRISGQEKND